MKEVKYLSPKDLFEQACKACPTQTDLDDYVQVRTQHGTKLMYIKSKEQIELYNTTLGGDFYEEFNEVEYMYFFTYGWDEGVRWMLVKNIKRRIKELQRRKGHKNFQTPELQQFIDEDIARLKSKMKWHQ